MIYTDKNWKPPVTYCKPNKEVVDFNNMISGGGRIRNLPCRDIAKDATPTDDTISRQAAIDAVERALFKRVAKAFIESLPPVEPTLKDLKKPNKSCEVENVEPKPVCEDAISRQDAIEALDHIHIPTQAQREYAIEIFEKIPPVEPKRPNGEWVDRIFDGCLKKECDQCGEMIDAYIFRQNRYNFCPNCGADCRGEGND